jgi:hypothetical protein
MVSLQRAVTTPPSVWTATADVAATTSSVTAAPLLTCIACRVAVGACRHTLQLHGLQTPANRVGVGGG